MDELKSLLQMTQEELKYRLFMMLREKQMNPVYEEGYVYAKGDIPILLVAHMDTVAPRQPRHIIYNEEEDILYNPEGILGGDDRCGVYAILKLLEKHRPHVLFTEDEEIGGLGAVQAVETLAKPDVKYIIEFDRQGKNDCVFYNCGNQKFIRYVKKFGFKEKQGTFSDIFVLGSAWDIASVNLSCGYYKEHTPKEHIVFRQLEKTISKADKMLNAVDKAHSFDYQDKEKSLNVVKQLKYLNTYYRGYNPYDL